ncbi:transporter substrate-binding domain-containing protein [Paraburkholderia sartisoli]|uniref:Amino acid ABC transporter substrate-binding protein, PAAT family n=1 Tax=Paraburkholderia sartisoli TaxID=83784 RepID=A0A1H4D1D6_9BURK|nr:transporter substrate-binding domain-containing protein [Paraburkholderia sartisoli]SEA66437.1 amino acid ABC transporter substrate-binding protein, PAAT family [Paraburkholderia sartisoli]
MIFRNRLSVTLVFSVLFALCGESTAATGEIPETLKKAGTLNVGVKCDAPPAAFLDTNGKPAGIDVDFSRYISSHAFGDADKVNFTCVTSATRIQMLVSGKVDLVIATMSPTEERKRVVDFTDSTNWGAAGILIRRGDKYSRLDDFDGKTIISLKGGWQAQYLKSHYPKIHLVLLDSMNDAITAMRQGRADGLAEDVKALLPTASRDPDMVVSDINYGISWGAPAVRKGDESLRVYINKLIEEARRDGTFETSVKKYTSGPLQEAVLRGYLRPAPDGSTPQNSILK